MKTLAAIAALCLPMAAQAVYKCQGADGKVVYADMPCPPSSTSLEIPGLPEKARAPGAGPRADGAGARASRRQAEEEAAGPRRADRSARADAAERTAPDARPASAPRTASTPHPGRAAGAAAPAPHPAPAAPAAPAATAATAATAARAAPAARAAAAAAPATPAARMEPARLTQPAVAPLTADRPLIDFGEAPHERLASVVALLDSLALDGRECEEALKADGRLAVCAAFATHLSPGREWAQALNELHGLLKQPGLFERHRDDFARASELVARIGGHSRFMEERLLGSTR